MIVSCECNQSWGIVTFLMSHVGKPRWFWKKFFLIVGIVNEVKLIWKTEEEKDVAWQLRLIMLKEYVMWKDLRAVRIGKPFDGILMVSCKKKKKSIVILLCSLKITINTMLFTWQPNVWLKKKKNFLDIYHINMWYHNYAIVLPEYLYKGWYSKVLP